MQKPPKGCFRTDFGGLDCRRYRRQELQLHPQPVFPLLAVPSVPQLLQPQFEATELSSQRAGGKSGRLKNSSHTCNEEGYFFKKPARISYISPIIPSACKRA